MPIIPWKPFSELDNFFGEDDWFSPVLLGLERTNPAIDIYQTDKEVVAEANLPGIDPEKVNVSVEGDTLKINGQSEEKKEKKEKGYWRKEIKRGSFERTIKLPSLVKEKGIEAVYEKGILKITMPKAEPKTSPKIKVKIKGK
jgi:HSP20 family protein